MKALILRLDAPMMSFGTVMVDQHGFIDRFPATSMLCGLIANALGWQHSDFDQLQKLQTRITYAARWDVRPQRIVDYHTVDLGQPKMIGYANREKSGPSGGWTTKGSVEWRGGASKLSTHERYRHYWIDGLMSVALALKDEGVPNLDAVQLALNKPARPLFLGRKTCLPARPLLDPQTPMVEGDNVLSILRQVPIWNRYAEVVLPDKKMEACWPVELGASKSDNIRRVYELREWANQLPAGSRLRAEGLIEGDYSETTIYD